MENSLNALLYELSISYQTQVHINEFNAFL